MNSLSRFSVIMGIGLVLLFSGGCKLFKLSYTMTGGNIDPQAMTISITDFPNKASLVQPILSQAFTDALRDKFVSQTRLELVDDNGDYILEGEIVNYTTQPVAIQGNETAALNRLTITVNVRFFNRFDETQNFEQRFSRYQDYESTLNLSEVEEGLISSINEALVEDIFNKAVVNW